MLSRSLNLFIALLVITVIGIETHTYWIAQLRPWQPSTPIGRIIFYYSFFTVLSNIMVALSSLILAFKPSYAKSWFNVLRLNGLVGIVITMLVYNLMLRGIHKPPTPLLHFANESLHVVIPILSLFGWLIYGPFNRINLKIVSYSFLCLLSYGVYIFVRGYYTRLYPYPFINVNRVGYEKALIAVIGIAVLFFIIVLVLKCIDILRLKMIKSKTN